MQNNENNQKLILTKHDPTERNNVNCDKTSLSDLLSPIFLRQKFIY